VHWETCWLQHQRRWDNETGHIGCGSAVYRGVPLVQKTRARTPASVAIGALDTGMKKTTSNEESTPELAALEWVNDAYNPQRSYSRGESKYAAIFSQARLGARLKCPKADAQKLAAALKKWLISKGHENPCVSLRGDCGDGYGGVWWLGEKEAPETPPTLPRSVNPFERGLGERGKG